MRQPTEPSVEEILESIKQVMARDARALLAGDRAPVDDAAPDAADQAEDADVLDLVRHTPPPAPVDAAAAPLVTEAAASGMRGSLAALAAANAAPRAVATGASADALGALVGELLRPMLAAWLDKNLPPLVERMVAAEIARIVGERA